METDSKQSDSFALRDQRPEPGFRGQLDRRNRGRSHQNQVSTVRTRSGPSGQTRQRQQTGSVQTVHISSAVLVRVSQLVAMETDIV